MILVGIVPVVEFQIVREVLFQAMITTLEMDHSSKWTLIFEEKLNRMDIQNGAHYKDKCKVELGVILNSV